MPETAAAPWGEFLPQPCIGPVRGSGELSTQRQGACNPGRPAQNSPNTASLIANTVVMTIAFGNGRWGGGLVLESACRRAYVSPQLRRGAPIQPS